jgi:hypothetical protein
MPDHLPVGMPSAGVAGNAGGDHLWMVVRRADRRASAARTMRAALARVSGSSTERPHSVPDRLAPDRLVPDRLVPVGSVLTGSVTVVGVGGVGWVGRGSSPSVGRRAGARSARVHHLFPSSLGAPSVPCGGRERGLIAPAIASSRRLAGSSVGSEKRRMLPGGEAASALHPRMRAVDQVCQRGRATEDGHGQAGHERGDRPRCGGDADRDH